jgi:hypothetical protein
MSRPEDDTHPAPPEDLFNLIAGDLRKCITFRWRRSRI